MLLAICAHPAFGNEDRPDSSLAAQRSEIPEVAVAIAAGGDGMPYTHSIDTSLVVDDDVMVTARMGGTVEEILVDRGSNVRKGDPLLVLKNSDLKLYVDRAELKVELATLEFDRVKTLYEEKTVSASQFDISRLTLENARVDLEIAKEDLERSIVRAPFDGVVIDRFAKLGQKVIEDDDLPLFRITTLSPLLARLFLPEDISLGLTQGDQVEILPRYQQDGSVNGVVRWLSKVVDGSSGTRQAIVAVEQKKGCTWLVPGTSVTVVLNLSTDAHRSVLIPLAALGPGMNERDNGMARVRIVSESGVIWRSIRVGRIRGEEVEVLEGLDPGEKVVLGWEGRETASGR